MPTYCDAANLPRASASKLSTPHEGSSRKHSAIRIEGNRLGRIRHSGSGGRSVPGALSPTLRMSRCRPDVGTSAGSAGKLDCARNGKLKATHLRQNGSKSGQIQLDVSDSFLALTTGFGFFGRRLPHSLDFRRRRFPPRWDGQIPPHGGTLSAICQEPKRMQDISLKNTMPDKKIDLFRRKPAAIEVPISGLRSIAFQWGHGFESVVGESIGTRLGRHFPRGANAIFVTFPDLLVSRHCRAFESNLPGFASLRSRRPRGGRHRGFRGRSG